MEATPVRLFTTIPDAFTHAQKGNSNSAYKDYGRHSTLRL